MIGPLFLVIVLYQGAILATVYFALRKGDEPEQLTALVLATAALADQLNHGLFGMPNFILLNPGHLVIDSWLLVVMVWMALYANRGWPLWVGALQIIAVAGHLAKLLDVSAIRRGYWAMIAVPGYIQLVVLWLGLFAHVRRVRRIGAYAAWRPRQPRPPRDRRGPTIKLASAS